MHRLRVLGSAAALLAALGGLFGPATACALAPTADEIIAHHVEARGGSAPLLALKTLKRTGRLIVPGLNLELLVVESKGRGGAYRQDMTLQGLTAIQAYDGHDAWQVQPFAGRKDPARMSDDEAKAFALGADITLPFVDYRTKGHRVEYLGLEDIDGTPAHKLRVALKWGDEATYWIDPDTWMVIRELDRQTVRGATQFVETDYGDYQQVAGVYVPMSEEQGPKDSDASQKQKIVYDTVNANVELPQGYFAFPTPAAKAAAEVRP